MLNIITACGSGVATSQTIASKVSKMLKENGYREKVEAVDIKSLDQHIKKADVYIAITKPNKEYDVPVLNGVVFLTGMGMQEEFQKLTDLIDASK